MCTFQANGSFIHLFVHDFAQQYNAAQSQYNTHETRNTNAQCASKRTRRGRRHGGEAELHPQRAVDVLSRLDHDEIVHGAEPHHGHGAGDKQRPEGGRRGTTGWLLLLLLEGLLLLRSFQQNGGIRVVGEIERAGGVVLFACFSSSSCGCSSS